MFLNALVLYLCTIKNQFISGVSVKKNVVFVNLSCKYVKYCIYKILLNIQ